MNELKHTRKTKRFEWQQDRKTHSIFKSFRMNKTICTEIDDLMIDRDEQNS